MLGQRTVVLCNRKVGRSNQTVFVASSLELKEQLILDKIYIFTYKTVFVSEAVRDVTDRQRRLDRELGQ